MNKYNARKTVIDGIEFDSRREAERYQELQILERAGYIKGLKIHPIYTLIDGFEYRGKRERPIKYEGDFQYVENGEIVCEDVKGVRTKVFMLKQKLFKLRYPTIDFRIVR
jgi:hypothetical protein